MAEAWKAKTNIGDTVNKTYRLDDVVQYGSKDVTYRCRIEHVASNTFPVDFLLLRWEKVISINVRYVEPWQAKENLSDTENALYYLGDKVTYGNLTYTCTVPHIAASAFITDFILGYWNKGLSGIVPWTPRTPFCRGDNITYGHIRFCCNVGHESSVSFKDDLINPVNLSEVMTTDYRLRGFYTSKNYEGTAPEPYTVNQIVFYRGKGYICKLTHTIDATDGTSDAEILAIEATIPGYGSAWETYWTEITYPISSEGVLRWGGARFWYEKDIVKVRDIYYICIQNYDGSEKQSMDLYEPGFGSDYKSMWAVYSIWELIPTRNIFIPNWMSEVAYLSDYVKASEETFLRLVDYPLVRLNKLRDLSTETERDTLSRTIEMLGYPLPAYSDNLLKLNTLHLYAASMSQYNEDSGTKYYLNFLNFIIAKPESSPVGVLPQYVLTPTTIDTNWTTIPLYTRDYATFWTREELLVMFGLASGYVYKELWDKGASYAVKDTIQSKGWLWTALVANSNSEPSRTNANWVLTCLQTVVDADTLLDASDLLYLNDQTEYSDPVEAQQHGYYQTSRVYLYRSDRADYIGLDLETNADWAGISDLFYSFAPANTVIHIKELGYDCSFATLNLVEISPERSEICDTGYIPFICGDVVVYPIPAPVRGWSGSLGTSISGDQNNFIPELNSK